jgi:TRAP transporter 4TM/12TM fusion protein
MTIENVSPPDPVIDSEDTGPKRELSRRWSMLAKAIGVAMSVFHVYFLGFSTVTPWILYSAHLCFGSVLILLLFAPGVRIGKQYIPFYDLLLILAAILSTGYIIVEMDELVYRIGVAPTGPDILFSTILVLLVLEITRRTTGPVLPLVAVVFLLYAKYGDSLPGMMGHRGYTWAKIITYMTGLDAIFSVPLGASATFVFLFVLFSAFLHTSGAGRFFIDFALGITGSTRGGPAKTAVIASALFGTISGNSAANVVATGAFTIPLMKSIGYKPSFAGAVEAVASTGGQIMPPILGSAAFILAQLVGVPYLRVMEASLIPALLYFTTVFIMVDLEAVKLGLKGLPRAELPSVKKIIVERGHLMLPVFVLMFVLVVMMASTIMAALYGIAATVVIAAVRRDTRMGPAKILEALSRGANDSLGIISSCATAGIVIGVLNLTGSGLKFASAVISLSGEFLPAALVLTMAASLVLGMGLPTTAAYMICAAVVAPALVQMGVPNLAAHMFVFYFACISAITPPVALAAYAGAGIARANPLQVGITACKLGTTAFLVPFMFIYGLPLLWVGSLAEILLATMTSLIGVSALACALQGQLLHIPMRWGERLVLTLAALGLIKPGIYTDLLGGLLIILVVGAALFRERRRKAGGRVGGVGDARSGPVDGG